jgi:hypothetical protein
MRLRSLFYVSIATLAFAACSEKEDAPGPQYRQRVFNYDFNKGQVVGFSGYAGTLDKSLRATLTLDELPKDSTRITLNLINTKPGVPYFTGAFDATDTTDFGYALYPNARVFSKFIAGTGGNVSTFQLVNKRFDSLVNNYNGYLVVQDTTYGVGMSDSLSSSAFLIFGTFAR